GPSGPHGSLKTAVPTAQYTASHSVAPAVQRYASVPAEPITSQPQVDPHPPLEHASSQEQQLSSGESSEDSGGCTSEEDELEGVDVMPVRDTSCQTSMDRHTVMLSQKNKLPSPEKTARKVKTVKYLLGELKTLVAHQDSEAVRLIAEVEESVSLLPAMVGSTNVQAELALALQPLRSENVQLRRRLRILNQQLQERERAERQARPVDCNLELVSLQSLNFTLQTQLNDSHRELGSLRQENQRLRQALEEKGNDLQHNREQCELETSRIRMDVHEALDEMRNCQAKFEHLERENGALTQSLHQKEAEITGLQEIIRDVGSTVEHCACTIPGTNSHGGLKFLGLAFEKLGISNELPSQDLKVLDENKVRGFPSHSDRVGLQVTQTDEDAVDVLEQLQPARRCLWMGGDASVYTGQQPVFESTFSSCDIKSLASDCSVNSWSTFNTCKEKEFQNGLAALDASIANLQRTLKADLKI
uniref:Coiled-coil domain containing 14 n=1 Tax=Electrophorus electricus TaxID=8005 RepID=A0A4W4FCW1_ELEEL